MSTVQKYPQTYYVGITKSAHVRSCMVLDYISWHNSVHLLSLNDDVVTDGIPYFLLSPKILYTCWIFFLEWRPTDAIIV